MKVYALTPAEVVKVTELLLLARPEFDQRLHGYAHRLEEVGKEIESKHGPVIASGFMQMALFTDLSTIIETLYPNQPMNITVLFYQHMKFMHGGGNGDGTLECGKCPVHR